MPADQLGRGPQAAERIPQAVGHRRGHFADGGELLGLHQLGLGPLQLIDFPLELAVESRHVGPGLAQVLGHAAERLREVPDLVSRGGRDRILELPRAHDGHRPGELADRPGEASRDEPGRKEPGGQGKHDDRKQGPGFGTEDLLQAGVGTPHAGLAGPAIDLPIHRGQGG